MIVVCASVCMRFFIILPYGAICTTLNTRYYYASCRTGSTFLRAHSPRCFIYDMHICGRYCDMRVHATRYTLHSSTYARRCNRERCKCTHTLGYKTKRAIKRSQSHACVLQLRAITQQRLKAAHHSPRHYVGQLIFALIALHIERRAFAHTHIHTSRSVVFGPTIAQLYVVFGVSVSDFAIGGTPQTPSPAPTRLELNCSWFRLPEEVNDSAPIDLDRIR